MEYERGLLYRGGKFSRILDPGMYWHLRFFRTIQKFDVRAHAVTIPDQELLTSDNISIKVSLAANYKVHVPYRAINETVNYHTTLYLLLQLHLRDLIGAVLIDELLAMSAGGKTESSRQ